MLAKYACDYRNSRGRLHEESPSKNRSPFQRDRDRIIHSQSFRRLEYKTQVFINYESDHFRNRLTHSLEVAQISRAIAKKLNLDQDLSEALALVHDIGHPPFGHAGEEALNKVMKAHGGFDHNAHALKILTKLEDPYAEFDGLNLTAETLEGVVKHNGPLRGWKVNKDIKNYNKKHDLALKQYPSLEAQIAAISDDIAYNNHDIDDGIRAGLIVIEDFKDVAVVGDAITKIDKKYPNLAGHKRLYEIRRIIYSNMVDDLIANASSNIKKHNIETYEDVCKADNFIVTFSNQMAADVAEIKRILFAKVYHHSRVKIMSHKSQKIITDLFDFYMNNPDCFDVDLSSKEDDYAVAVCDYIAGMTDRFAIRHHQEVFDIYFRQQNFK